MPRLYSNSWRIAARATIPEMEVVYNVPVIPKMAVEELAGLSLAPDVISEMEVVYDIPAGATRWETMKEKLSQLFKPVSDYWTRLKNKIANYWKNRK